MRVFLAIEIPQDIKEELVEVQEELKSRITGVRWEKPEKLHLTLVFLGKVSDERVGELEGAIRKGIKGLKGLKIGLSGVRVFPNERRPRVVLVEVGPAPEQARCGVKELQERLAAALAEAGFEFSRLKKPHVTLGRFSRHIRSSSASKVQVDAPGLQQILRSWQRTDVVGFEVNEVVIMESKLHPAGAIHTPIARIPL